MILYMLRLNPRTSTHAYMSWTSCRVKGSEAHPLWGQRWRGSAPPIGGTCRRRTWCGIIREVMALVWGSLDLGRGAVTHWFPSLWPPVLFPPGLQRLELVKRLGCTDLNSSYSPQKTLALANQLFFFSTPIVFLCNEHMRCLFLPAHKEATFNSQLECLRAQLLETMTEVFLLAERLVVVR